ncbi:hypothetical protein EUGRSUZ_A00476, partial [Eucalyptus grandis]
TRFSQLPGHITDKILSRLPIKEAVRTRILSSKWRYKCSSLPNLVFDDRCTSTTGIHSPQLSLNENSVKIIDEVLLLHTGSIQKFKLSHKGFCTTSNIDRWILHLSRVSIESITLVVWKGQNYKIPTSLFNCQKLMDLKLIRCVIKIPPRFEGFKNLRSLYLLRVELSPDSLEALISQCPLLKDLSLVEGITRVNVKACNLERLLLQGGFQDVVFGVMNHLKSVTYLFTCIDFNSVEEIWTIMCLIRSSPLLKQVDFKARTEKRTTVGLAANYWEDHQSSCFQQVRVASLDNISGSQPELRFIKFLLSHLRGLQKMRIKPKNRSEDGKLVRELLRFPRTSAQAELIFLDPVNP